LSSSHLLLFHYVYSFLLAPFFLVLQTRDIEAAKEGLAKNQAAQREEKEKDRAINMKRKLDKARRRGQEEGEDGGGSAEGRGGPQADVRLAVDFIREHVEGGGEERV
jgi:hypothetical protein